MQIKRYENNLAVDSILLPLREQENFSGLDNRLREIVNGVIERKDFTGKKGSLFRIPVFDSSLNVKNLYLLGLGKNEKCNLKLIRDSLAWGLRSIGRQHNKSVRVILEGLKDYEGLCFAFGEAAGLCGLCFVFPAACGRPYREDGKPDAADKGSQAF